MMCENCEKLQQKIKTLTREKKIIINISKGRLDRCNDFYSRCQVLQHTLGKTNEALKKLRSDIMMSSDSLAQVGYRTLLLRKDNERLEDQRLQDKKVNAYWSCTPQHKGGTA